MGDCGGCLRDALLLGKRHERGVGNGDCGDPARCPCLGRGW